LLAQACVGTGPCCYSERGTDESLRFLTLRSAERQ
jgi:hypothetical protein